MENIPEIKEVCRLQLFDMKNNVLRYKNNTPIDIDKIIRADTNFFTFFSFDLINGNPTKCLDEPASIVLSESTARMIFGNSNPIGELLSYNNQEMVLKVTAIVEDPPPNSSLQFNAVMSVNSLPVIYPSYLDKSAYFWSFNTMIKTRSGVPKKDVESKAGELFYRMLPENSRAEAIELFQSKFTINLKPFKSIYFDNQFKTYFKSKDPKQIYILILIGVLILSVCIINYINLSVTTAFTRCKEVGIRFTLGASKISICRQFLTESYIISFIAILLALWTGNFLIEIINKWSYLEAKLVFFGFPTQLAILFFGSLVIGILAGIYPSAYMAQNQQVNEFKTPRGTSIRNSLLVLQFLISSGLIISTIVIVYQFNYISRLNMGFNKEDVLKIKMSEKILNKYHFFVSTLNKSPLISSTSRGSDYFLQDSPSYPLEVNQNNQINSLEFKILNIDTSFLELIGCAYISGKPADHIKKDTSFLLVNEIAAHKIGINDNLENIENITIRDKNYNKQWRIAGVVKNFNHRSLQYPIDPLIIFFTPDNHDLDVLYVKIANQNQTKTAINFLSQVWNSISPESPFNYVFFEDSVDELYRTEDNFRKMFFGFSLFSIFISCLGLYGLTAFIIYKKTKEISIRKVLGAKSSDILMHILKSFLVKVAIAFVLACPVAYILMNNWLNAYAYKIAINLWIFIVAGLLVFMISFLTIFGRCLYASLQNPVDNLKYE